MAEQRSNFSGLGWLLPAILCAAIAIVTYYTPGTPNRVPLAAALLTLLCANFAPWRHGVMITSAILSVVFTLGVIPQLGMVSHHAEALPIDLLGIWLAAALLIWDPRRSNLSHHDLHQAFASTPTAMLVIDHEGNVEQANQASAELLGADLAGFSDTTFEALIGTSVWEALASHLEAIDQGKALQLDFTLNTTNRQYAGTPRQLSCHITRLGEADTRRCYFVQLLDHTEALLREAELISAENRHRHLFEQSGDLILTVDQTGTIVEANPRTAEAFGSDLDIVVGSDILQYVHPQDQYLFTEHLERSRARTGGQSTLPQLQLNTPATTYVDVKMKNLAHLSGIGGTMITCRIITDYVESVRKLRASKEQFSSIFHASPDGMLILRNDDSVILDFNEGWSQLFGYTREQLIGERLRETPIWTDEATLEPALQALAGNGNMAHGQCRLHHADGHEIDVSLSQRYFEIGGRICTLMICRDISAEVQAQTALRESEAKFSTVFAHSPDGMVILRQKDASIYDINDVMVSASGFSRDELVGKPVMSMNVFADLAEVERGARLLESHRSFNNLSLTFRDRNGKPLPTLASATMIELNGEQYALFIVKDMREAQKAEERLRRSEQRFRGIFENAPVGILLADVDGRVVQSNHYAAALLAYDESQMSGLHIAKLIPREDRGILKERMHRLLSGTENVSITEQRMLCGNGLEIWTNMHIVVQKDSNGKPLYCIVQIADITENKYSQQRMERLAYYDALTNLANRALFNERLQQAIDHAQRHRRHAALLYLDLDQFKRVNDTLGHETGDQLLREVARRLNECVRKEDTVGRSGGDEFTVLLFEIGTPGDAGLVAEKILARLQEPIHISGYPLVVTTSIGITIIPADGTDANVLTKNADLAMYKAKEGGRNNYRFYTADMNVDAARRLRTEYELRHALKHNEFELYYQPKVRLRDQKVVGAEALIRWNHPERGLVSPGEFVDIAEETGAIVDIGNWVIAEACKAAKVLSADAGFPIYIALNISARQFRDPNLVTTIRRALRQAKVNPNFIEIEITETMLMQDVESAALVIEQLANLGLRIAVDDFGTGYSSLNYLKKFPINTLKVDRSFIMDIPTEDDDKAITAAVIAMAHQLNIQVVAEGVETRAQLEFLNQANCEYAQGYLFSKPVPLNQFRRLLQPNLHLLRIRQEP